jgi:hypothetical protein
VVRGRDDTTIELFPVAVDGTVSADPRVVEMPELGDGGAVDTARLCRELLRGHRQIVD